MKRFFTSASSASSVSTATRAAFSRSRHVRSFSLLRGGPVSNKSIGDSVCCAHRCYATNDGWSNNSGKPQSIAHDFMADDVEGLREELASALDGDTGIEENMEIEPLEPADANRSSTIKLEKMLRPPAKFDLLTSSFVYRWDTTAAQARKISGPMREWAAELKYRTGVHIEVEPMFPDRLLAEDGSGYANADEVDVVVYLFGTERGIFNCQKLMESALQEDPVYVRLAVFRRIPNSDEIEWLLLRRINRELRPPDIPPISLKTPGKWTLLYEQYKEAALRTLWEETGIVVEPEAVFPTAQLHQTLPQYYWRVPVRYYIAEVPYEVSVSGPQVAQNSYMRGWDPRLLRQSPDPVDRAWALLADPVTGCAWMQASMIDELQKPLKGDGYMAARYIPPPYSGLQEVVRLGPTREGSAPSKSNEQANDNVRSTETVSAEKESAETISGTSPNPSPAAQAETTASNEADNSINSSTDTTSEKESNPVKDGEAKSSPPSGADAPSNP